MLYGHEKAPPFHWYVADENPMAENTHVANPLRPLLSFIKQIDRVRKPLLHLALHVLSVSVVTWGGNKTKN